MLLLHADTTELKKIKNKNMMKVFLEAQNQEKKNYFFLPDKVVFFRSTSRLWADSVWEGYDLDGFSYKQLEPTLDERE